MLKVNSIKLMRMTKTLKKWSNRIKKQTQVLINKAKNKEDKIKKIITKMTKLKYLNNK